jgi:hypothetical protein
MHLSKNVKTRDELLVGLTQAQEEQILSEMVANGYIESMSDSDETENWSPERSITHGNTRAHTADV